MLVLATALIDRYILNIRSLFPIHFHKLVGVAIFASQKFLHEDVMWDNKEFAKLMGLSLSSLNLLELEFLNFIEFQLFLTNYEFEEYLEELLLGVALEH